MTNRVKKTYHVVVSFHLMDLTLAVSNWKDNGWKCQGGVFQNNIGEYLQAMVRDE